MQINDDDDGDCRSILLGLYNVKNRAGLRHVRRVQANRAADFRGPPFWKLSQLISVGTANSFSPRDALLCKARYCDRILSVRPSVRPSVCDF